MVLQKRRKKEDREEKNKVIGALYYHFLAD